MLNSKSKWYNYKHTLMKTKNVITLFFASLLSLTIQAQHQTTSIEIQINDISSDKGSIRIGLYNSESNFYKKLYKSTSIKAKKGSIKVVLDDILIGHYAISLYHDENNNKELDSNFLGIPKEPYGTSNNAKGTFGPPSWEDAKFSVSEKTGIQSINL